MRFSCEIQTFSTVKKGSRITLALDDAATEVVLKGIQNYNKLPLTCILSVDVEQRRQQLAMISPEQRAKCYAIIKDIAAYVGDSPDSMKLEMKRQFCADKQQDDFSLASCSKDLAGEFIEWLICWAFENAVELKHAGHPKGVFDDPETYFRLCIEKKICCICGGPMDGPGHHVQAIGMGRNRKTYDDSGHERIALCRKHHTEAETIGWLTFSEKYHVIGVLV